MFCTNCSFEKFLFSLTAKLWNLLPTDIQESKTLSAFAIRLKKYYGIILSPNFTNLYGEDQKVTAIHCMLRMGHSSLNISKYFRKCACGKTKTTEHLLLDCKLTECYRNTLVCKTQSVSTNFNTKVNLMFPIKNSYSNCYSKDQVI